MTASSKAPMLEISWEWTPAEGVRSAELAATFARLEIKVGDDHVTLVEDRQTRSSRRAIIVSLYPMAEWIVFNWWFIQVGTRVDNVRHSYDARHSLRASGDGFLWPNLNFFTEGVRTRVSWQRDKGFGSSSTLRYLSQGEARVDSIELQFVLAGFVSRVIERLGELGIQGTELQAEWAALQAVDGEEREFCIASARLGLDPFADGPKFESEILLAAESLPAELLPTFYGAVAPENISSAILWVSQSIQESERLKRLDDAVLTARQGIVNSAIPRSEEPWTIGWRQAAAVREALGVDVMSRFEVTKFVEAVTRPAPEGRIKAAGVGGTSPSNVVVVGKRYPAKALSFTLARALWHLVAADAHSYLVTSAHTEAQRIERAFAAELLAPARGIAESIGPLEAVEDEDLESIADVYGVATTVIEHQLQNQMGAAPLE